MAQKKAKVSFSALFTDKLHTNELPSDSSPLTPLTPEADIATHSRNNHFDASYHCNYNKVVMQKSL
jgi:hypothetical protein